MNHFTHNNFIPKTQICSNCLLIYLEPDRSKENKDSSDQICPACERFKDIDLKKQKKRWKQQLELFLNFKPAAADTSPDVLVNYSGGTESTLALYIASKELKLNVVAFTVDNSWTRPEILEKSKKFCLKHQIPQIIVKHDFKAIFLEQHRNIRQVSDKAIINYPWCSICMKMIGYQIPRLLKTRRVLGGDNYAYGYSHIGEIEPESEMGRFISKHKQLLQPPAVLVVYPESIYVSLLPALGYGRKKITQRLIEIGYHLPGYSCRTYGTDCHLATALPCASRLFNTRQLLPKASANMEFHWGALTREEWLDQLIRVNSFSKEDSELALQFIRKEIENYIPAVDDLVTFNSVFSKKYKRFNKKELKDSLLHWLKGKKHLANAAVYYFTYKKYRKAINEIKELLALNYDDCNNGNTYDFLIVLGKCYIKTRQYKKAAETLKKAGEMNPGDAAVNFSLAEFYKKTGQNKQADRELKKGFYKQKISHQAD
ncbi:tetratricopeptide repeat protein [Elusimicrobiota bacterium]